MAFEMPLIIYVIGRMPDAEINIAALGGVALPIGFMIEAPILMFLSASTALAKDRRSYEKVRGFMHASGAILTAIHILISFTPIYYLMAQHILAVPERVVEPTRYALMAMTPWTWAIADRRFHQGALIRYGRSGAVGMGTVVRLASLVAFLLLGSHFIVISGAVLGGFALSVAVIAEAIFVRVKINPVLHNELADDSSGDCWLTTQTFLRFYIPLALTSILGMFTQPLGSGSLSRMPNAFDSLVVWPVLGNLIFIFRCTGLAVNEVVIAKLEDPKDSKALFPFCVLLMLVNTLILLLVCLSPLADLWFCVGASFPQALCDYGRNALYFAIPLPALTVIQHWYQANLLAVHNTRPVTEAIAIFIVISVILLAAGVYLSSIPGLYYFSAVMLLGSFCQTMWLGRAKRINEERRRGG